MRFLMMEAKPKSGNRIDRWIYDSVSGEMVACVKNPDGNWQHTPKTIATFNNFSLALQFLKFLCRRRQVEITANDELKN